MELFFLQKRETNFEENAIYMFFMFIQIVSNFEATK